MKPQIKAPRVTPAFDTLFELKSTHGAAMCVRGVDEPAGFRHDERRLNVTVQSTQSEAAIYSGMHEKAQLFRTRMTQINRNFGLRSVGVCFAYPSFDKTFLKFFGRIFTDEFNPCASVLSVKSVFYRNYCGIQIKAIGGI